MPVRREDKAVLSTGAAEAAQARQFVGDVGRLRGSDTSHPSGITVGVDGGATVVVRMLGISRPTLMKLVYDGAIPSHKVGSHTWLRSADLTECCRRRAAQRAAFDDLRAYEDELDVVD